MEIALHISNRIGLVESRLRQLLMKLEMVENVELVHPWVDNVESVVTFESLRDAMNGGYYKIIMEDIPASEADYVPKKLHKAVFYMGFQVSQKGGSLDLQYPIRAFRDLTMNWEKYNPLTMGVYIDVVKRYAYFCLLLCKTSITFLTSCLDIISLLLDHWD